MGIEALNDALTIFKVLADKEQTAKLLAEFDERIQKLAEQERTAPNYEAIVARARMETLRLQKERENLAAERQQLTENKTNWEAAVKAHEKRWAEQEAKFDALGRDLAAKEFDLKAGRALLAQGEEGLRRRVDAFAAEQAAYKEREGKLKALIG